MQLECLLGATGVFQRPGSVWLAGVEVYVDAVLSNEQVFGQGFDLAVVLGFAAEIVGLRRGGENFGEECRVEESVFLIVGESSFTTNSDYVGIGVKASRAHSNSHLG